MAQAANNNITPGSELLASVPFCGSAQPAHSARTAGILATQWNDLFGSRPYRTLRRPVAGGTETAFRQSVAPTESVGVTSEPLYVDARDPLKPPLPHRGTVMLVLATGQGRVVARLAGVITTVPDQGQQDDSPNGSPIPDAAAQPPEAEASSNAPAAAPQAEAEAAEVAAALEAELKAALAIAPEIAPGAVPDVGAAAAPESVSAIAPDPPPPRETHWMTEVDLKPFDPGHRYRPDELRALAAAYCKLNSIHGRPLGGDAGRRQYGRDRLLPRIPQCLWPMQPRSPKQGNSSPN